MLSGWSARIRSAPLDSVRAVALPRHGCVDAAGKHSGPADDVLLSFFVSEEKKRKEKKRNSCGVVSPSGCHMIQAWVRHLSLIFGHALPVETCLPSAWYLWRMSRDMIEFKHSATRVFFESILLGDARQEYLSHCRFSPLREQRTESLVFCGHQLYWHSDISMDSPFEGSWKSLDHHF